MANKRMLMRELLRTDNYLSLTARAQTLYIALLMEADDEGIVANPENVRLSHRARKGDLALLEEKGYIFFFSSGKLFITHWWTHNTIRKDRFVPSIHRVEADYIRYSDPRPVGYPEFLIP